MIKKYHTPCLSFFVVACFGMFLGLQDGWAQQAISNPLVRPAGMGNGSSSGGPANAASAAQSAKADPGAGQAPGAGGNDLRDKAASRISQEDFNLKQQALNASTVPAPLSALFSQMSVSAFVGGVVVMRRADFVATTQALQTVQTVPAQQVNGQQPNASSSRAMNGGAQTGGTVITSSALRLRVGQNTNLSGYVLRARVEGMDVFVDWKNDQGAWIGVFFGALESAQNVSLTPSKDSLEKVDTSSFDYLKPQVSNKLNTSTGTNSQNGASTNNSSSSGSSTSSGLSSF
jgi:hypothetical protein